MIWRRFWRVASLRILCACLAFGATIAHSGTFSVTSTADNGLGTFRQAVLDANADTTSPRAINFNIAGPGVHTITLLSALPDITRTMTIDGTTQPGYTSMPLIVLDGNFIDADGLVVNSFFTGSGNGPAIKALCIINFGANGGTPRNGLVLRDGDVITVTGCFIGTNPAGTAAARNTGAGIRVENFPYSIGGTTPADRNVISGNLGPGIDIASAQTTIRGNYIGTSADGLNPIPNGGDGIVTDGGGSHTIGGTAAGAGNVISGNAGNGVHIKRFANVTGNIIGLGSDGVTPLGNTMNGVLIEGTSGRVGNATPDTRNIISANGGNGVRVAGTTTANDFVFNNYIGTDISGTLPRGNGSHGVEIVSGALRISSNVIAANHGVGLRVGSGNGNVSNNLIGVNAAGNAALGNTGDGILIDNAMAGNITINTIGGNTGSGIRLIGANAHDIFILGNRIGMSLTSAVPLGNGGDGVTIVNGAQDEVIGSATGFVFGEANTIANNTGAGILYTGRNKVLVNSIFNNGGLALDRGGNGVDPSVPGSPLNPPIVSKVEVDLTSGDVTVDYSLDAAVNDLVRLRFYAGDPATRDPSGSGEIANFIGSVDVMTDGAGHAQGAAIFHEGTSGTVFPQRGDFVAGVGQTNPTGSSTPSDTTEAGGGVFVTGAPVVLKTETVANHVASGDTGHPINTFTGELFDFEAIDLNLRGPFPLVFGRYYASRLIADGNISSALGRNRLHNFDAKLTVIGSDATAALNDGRVVTFTKSGGVWTLGGRGDIPFQFVESGANYILGDPRNNTLWTFNAAGKLTTIEDGHGNSQALTYNGSGQLTDVSDGLGRTLAFTYDGGGHLTRVTDQTERHVDYSYSGPDLATATDPLGHVTTFTYDANGRLVSVTRPRGDMPLSQTYDSSGRVVTQTEHPAGADQTLAIAYDTTTNTTTVTDPLGQTRVDKHTATGELTEFRDEANKAILLGSDGTGRRASVTDRLGHTTTIAYHAASGKPSGVTAADNSSTFFDYVARTVSGITLFELQKITYPDGNSRSFTYDASGNLLTAVDQLGMAVAFTYNNRGQVLTATNARGGVTTLTYDNAGNLATSKDGDVAETAYAYDALSRLTRATFPDGAHFDLSYDAADRIATMGDERGNSYSFSYDTNGNLTTIADPTNAAVQFGYDALDRLTQLVNRLGKTRIRTFDPRDDIATETDELSHTTTFSQDARRRISAISDPGNATVLFGYDDEGALTSITDPLGQTTTFLRNVRGQLVSSTDPLGQSIATERDSLQRITSVTDEAGRTSTFSFNAAGLLLGASREGAGTANYVYDADHHLTRITDPKGANWDLTYTPSGLFSSSKDPLGRVTGYAYDTLGRISSLALPEGGSCSIEHDAADNITRMLFTDGTDLHFGYDALDRVISANNIAVTRDAEGRITGSVSGGVSFGATYDDAGRLTSVSYNNGAVVVGYAYDVNDRLASVSDNVSGASVTFARDASGRVISLTRSNGVNAALTYDAADRLIRAREGTFLDLQYTLNAAGDVVSVDFTAPAIPSVSADTKQFTYNVANEVSASGYTYDLRGRLTAAPGHTFAWNAASLLKQIDATSFDYDGFGDLFSRTAAGVTTRFFHHPAIDGRPIVTERNETTGQFTRFYVWMPGGTLLYAIDAATNAVSFYHYDRVGSTLALTDGTGAVTDSYAYTPYGELLAHNGTSSQPFTFTGALGTRADGSVYQMHARYYDPVTGRFLSRDPAAPRLSEVRSLDSYTYAFGNPVLYVDRTGAEPLQALPSSSRPNNFHPPSLFGGLPKEDVSLVELAGAALAFGNDTQIVGTGLGLLFAELEKNDLPLETNVEQPRLPAGEVFRASNPGSKTDALVRDGLNEAGGQLFLNAADGGPAFGAAPPITPDSVVSDQMNQVSNRNDSDQGPGPKSKGPLQLFKKFVKKALALQKAQKEQAEREAQAKEKAEKKQKKEEAKKAKEDKKLGDENKEKYKKEFGVEKK